MVTGRPGPPSTIAMLMSGSFRPVTDMERPCYMTPKWRRYVNNFGSICQPERKTCVSLHIDFHLSGFRSKPAVRGREKPGFIKGASQRPKLCFSCLQLWFWCQKLLTHFQPKDSTLPQPMFGGIMYGYCMNPFDICLSLRWLDPVSQLNSLFSRVCTLQINDNKNIRAKDTGPYWFCQRPVFSLCVSQHMHKI